MEKGSFKSFKAQYLCIAYIKYVAENKKNHISQLAPKILLFRTIVCRLFQV